MVVVVRITWAASPCPDADVGLAVCEGADEVFELWVIFDSIDPRDISGIIEMDTLTQRRSGVVVGSMPGIVEVLHESRIAFAGGGLVDLLNSHVTASTHNVAQIEEIVALVRASCQRGALLKRCRKIATSEAILGDLRLFTFMPIMQGDDSSRCTVLGLDHRCVVCLNRHVAIVVPSMNLKLLIMVGQVGNVDVMHNNIQSLKMPGKIACNAVINFGVSGSIVGFWN